MNAPKLSLFLTCLLICSLSLVSLPARSNSAFSFVTLGDTAYRGAKDYPDYESLIERINKSSAAFTIHVGDIWGVGPCTDENYAVIADFFARYQKPVVLTPGDNEWTDCHPAIMGGFDPIDRLNKLRSQFFSTAESMGKNKMQLVRQADISEYKKFVENARWEKNAVLFVTVHVVGSSNNLVPHSESVFSEFYYRDAANVAWLNDSFRIAQQEDFKAVVIALHANMYKHDQTPYAQINKAIRLGAERFAKPVLLIHGDSHEFIIDKPYFEENGELGEPNFDNVTRLQVYGPQTVRAITVSVEPETPWVFGFTPLYDK